MPLSQRSFESLPEVIAGGRRLTVENVWDHEGKLVFKFEGIDSISDAESLAGCDVCVPREERAPLEEGAFYVSDLIGCEVLDFRSGKHLGAVTGWHEFGPAPLLEVRTPEDKELLIPFARSMCREIAPEQRRIVVELPEGLLDLNA